MKINYGKKFYISFPIALIVALVCDILTKLFIYGTFSDFLPGFLSIFSTENTGASWSMLSDNQTLLIILSFVFLAILLVFNHFVKNKNILYSAGIGFVFGGAIGNLVDRLSLGYVRDFLKFEFIKFPIFNVADTFLCVGVALLLIYFIIEEVKNYKNKKGKK